MFLRYSRKRDRRSIKPSVAFSLILSGLILLASCSGKSVIQTKDRGFWYTFQRGDSIERIAERYSVDPWTLRKHNGIYDPDDLRPGIRIFIPGVRRIESKSRTQRKKTASRQSDRFIWPAQGVISSGYGKRHGKMHLGIDITRDGGRKIIAAKSGRVVFSGYRNGYGKTVVIDHGKGVKTLYAHNQTLYVKKNHRVQQGKQIAKMGSTGKSSGIHLHFEIIVNGKHQNPLRYLPIR